MSYEELKRSVNYAYEKVPFYIEKNIDKKVLNSEDEKELIRNIPIIGKDEIMEKGNLLSVEYSYNQSKKLAKVQTSGSTGKCMDILWDKQDMDKSLLPLWLYRLKYYGIRMDDRFCYFYTTGNKLESVNFEKDYEEGRNCLGFSKNNLSEERILQIYEMMKEYKPVWINTQPSIAVLLAECKKKHNLEDIPSLKYIELTGEMLFDNVKEEVRKAFNCNIANQYGCYEANSIAFECPCGKLHCMEDNIYLEVVNEQGKECDDVTEGDILITTLNSHAMPFIRYKVGDRGTLNKNYKCECGNESPIIEIKSGRISDYALMKDGSKINSYVFVHAISLVNMKFDSIIRQFQIIQKDYDYFLINLILDEELIDGGIHESEVEDAILESVMDERLYDTEFEFEYYDELFPDVLNGKLKYFIREKF